MGVAGRLWLNQTSAERLALRAFVWDELERGGGRAVGVKSDKRGETLSYGFRGGRVRNLGWHGIMVKSDKRMETRS